MNDPDQEVGIDDLDHDLSEEWNIVTVARAKRYGDVSKNSQQQDYTYTYTHYTCKVPLRDVCDVKSRG